MRTIRRMRVRAIATIALAAVTIGIVAAPTGPVAADDLVTLIGGTKRTLPNTDDGPAVVFPIDMTEAGAGGTITASVTEVLRGSVTIPESSVTARIDDEQRALELTVTAADAFAPAADYSVTVLLSDGGDNRQSITLTLARPAAQLTTGGVVEIEDFVGLFSGFNDDVMPALQIGIERAGAIRSLTARQVERSEGQMLLTAKCATEDGTATSCPLASEQPVTLLPSASSDGVLTLGYDPQDFPLGTTVRTVELRSPQLASPVTVSFEVTKRRSPYLIPLIVFVGMLMGLAVRTVLTGVLRWTRRRAAKQQFDDRVGGLRRRYADPGFHKFLDEAVAALGGKPKIEQIAERTQAVADQLDALNGELLTLRDGADEVGAAVAGSWTLPARLRARIEAVEEAVAAVRTQLDQRNATEAGQQLATARQVLEDVRSDATDWAGNYRQAAGAAKAAVADLEGSWPITRLEHVFADTEGRAVVDAGADTRATIAAVHASNRDWQRDVEPAIRAAIAERAARAPQLATRAYTALRSGDALQRLGSVIEPLRALLNTPEPDASTERPGTVLLESARTAVAGATADDAAVDAVATLPAYDIGALQRIRSFPSRLATAVVGRAVRALLFVLLFAVIAFVAYSTGHDEWVGGSAQIASLFGWAFALDVTTATALALFGQQSASPPTFEPD